MVGKDRRNFEAGAVFRITEIHPAEQRCIHKRNPPVETGAKNADGQLVEQLATFPGSIGKGGLVLALRGDVGNVPKAGPVA